ncbi:argininosuccinate lyase, partial [Candidatus Poribacteria bacterium]
MKIGSKLWAGRFTSEMDNLMLDFTHSTETDSRLIPYDIWGSQVHALMLSHQNIINSTDLSPILIWLEKALSDFHAGRFVLDPTKEDVHMNVESYVIEGAGVEFGGKLHTARSRNDQVLTDTRLYSREQILIICSNLVVLCKAFIGIATKHTTTVMPGYTHTQHAQPISLGFW